MVANVRGCTQRAVEFELARRPRARHSPELRAGARFGASSHIGMGESSYGRLPGGQKSARSTARIARSMFVSLITPSRMRLFTSAALVGPLDVQPIAVCGIRKVAISTLARESMRREARDRSAKRTARSPRIEWGGLRKPEAAQWRRLEFVGATQEWTESP